MHETNFINENTLKYFVKYENFSITDIKILLDIFKKEYLFLTDWNTVALTVL